MTLKTIGPCFLLSLAVVTVGCKGRPPGQVEKQPTVPVTGMVTYKGRGVPNASVVFLAVDGKVASRGSTDGAGLFTLSSFGQQDGAPLGRYKVIVASSGVKEVEPGVLAPEPEGGFKSPVPTKYANPNTTDIVMQVKEEGKNDLTIELK